MTQLPVINEGTDDAFDYNQPVGVYLTGV